MSTLPVIVTPLASLVTGLAAAIATAGADGTTPGPVLVLAAPWTDGAALVAFAGGYAVLTDAPPRIGTVAHDHADGFVERLHDAGAWLVLDMDALAAIGCV